MKIRSAATLGPQIHMHWKAPDAPDRIRPVSMTFPRHVLRRPGQAFGGLWTATPNAYGSNACIDMAAINVLRHWRGTTTLRLWRLTPDPAATLAVIEDADDYRALCDRYPYPAGGIDVAALLADVDGLHVTEAAALAARSAPVIQSEQNLGLGMWVYESTHWRAYSFVACEEIPIETAAYPLESFGPTYLPVVLAMGRMPADPTIRAAVLADLEQRNRAALDAVAPVMQWLRRHRTQEARAGPSVAAD